MIKVKSSSYKIKIILSIAFIVLIFFIFYFLFLSKNNSESLQKFGITSNEKWIVTETTEDQINGTLGDNELSIKIVKNISEEKASIYIEERGILLQTLFDPKLPPYPEFLTKESWCQDEFRPVKKIVENGEYYLLYAGARHGYGVCDRDVVVYRASYGFLFCEKNQQVFNIEIFASPNISLDDLSVLSESIKCSK